MSSKKQRPAKSATRAPGKLDPKKVPRQPPSTPKMPKRDDKQFGTNSGTSGRQVELNPEDHPYLHMLDGPQTMMA